MLGDIPPLLEEASRGGATLVKSKLWPWGRVVVGEPGPAEHRPAAAPAAAGAQDLAKQLDVPLRNESCATAARGSLPGTRVRAGAAPPPSPRSPGYPQDLLL